MKTKFVLKNIEVAGVKIGEFAFEHECSATEAIKLVHGGKDFVKSFIKDIPEIASDLKKAYDCVEAINNEVIVEETVDVASVYDEYLARIEQADDEATLDKICADAAYDSRIKLDKMFSIARASVEKRDMTRISF